MSGVAVPKRIQRQRTKGWRMPADAIYVGRPSAWGNPWPWNDERATWMAVSFGQKADAPGRRTGAVIMFRWWMTGADPATFPVALQGPDAPGGAFEYTDGAIRSVADLATGLALMMFLKEPIALPERPALSPLYGHDLACWCPLDQPCHADVLLELANA